MAGKFKSFKVSWCDTYFVIIQVRDILEKTVVSFLSLFRILLHNKENLLKSTRPMHIKSFFSEYYLSQKSLRMYIIHTHTIVFKAVFKIAFLLLGDWVDFKEMCAVISYYC